MPTIHDLSSISSISEDDELVLYSLADSSTRKANVQALAVRINELNQGDPEQTVYPITASGSSVTVSVVPAMPGISVWALVTLAATAPTGTINLPGVDDRANGQEVLVTSTKAITALTVNGSGATVRGAPTSLAADGFFRLRYDSLNNTWYRVG